MQDLWARILSGEANKPESVSKRTLEFVSLMDRSDAETFSRLCNLSATSLAQPLLFSTSDPILSASNLTYKDLAHLDSIGLVQMTEGFGNFVRQGVDAQFLVEVGGRMLMIEVPEPKKTDKPRSLVLGRLLFTKTGEELRRFVHLEPVEGFYDYCVKSWHEAKCNLWTPLNQQ